MPETDCYNEKKKGVKICLNLEEIRENSDPGRIPGVSGKYIWVGKHLTPCHERWIQLIISFQGFHDLINPAVGNTLPDVIISHYEGFAERLCRVEPHSGIFLHCSGELSSDGRGAGVQSAGDGRKQRFI